MRVLLFGGTAEGRALCQWLLRRGVPFSVCVATQYGKTLLPRDADVRVGRLEQGEMAECMAGYTLVVDATHPYAARATRNIQAAAREAGLPCLRLLRPPEREEGCLTARDMAQAAQLLLERPGSVLLTTGSKELAHFSVPGLVERCYPRVLPMVDSLERCLSLGFPPAHILCMQGPFSRELNLALLRQYRIQTLVTKQTGGAGGFREKADAARQAGCALLVVERPVPESGLPLEEIQARIEELWKE